MTVLPHRPLRHGVLLLMIGCSGATAPSQGKSSSDTAVGDTPPSDTDTDTDTDTDSAEDTSESVVVDCNPISEKDGWELCSSTDDTCMAVFTDGAGCHELCHSVELGCAEVWDNVDGECAPNTSNAELGCDVLTGHDSDYCVCSGPMGEIPEPTSETSPYEDILTERVGFGANTTGGRNGTVCLVTSTASAGSGSLKDCVESASGPWWIRFAVDGEIELSSRLTLPSNLTIDGRDRAVEITGAGLQVLNQSNVIITNLSFHSGGDWDDNDAIQIRGGHDIWVHHCTLSSYADGLIDLTKGTRDVTISWNKFSDHDKVMLISANDADTEDEDTRVTLHHNWFKQTTQRHPRIRHGKLHAYNNFIDRWESYGMGCSTNSECYSERNVFQADDDDDAIVYQVGEDEGRGEVESHEDLLLGRATVQERGSVFNPADFYAYTADSTTGLAEVIQAGAGVR